MYGDVLKMYQISFLDVILSCYRLELLYTVYCKYTLVLEEAASVCVIFGLPGLDKTLLTLRQFCANIPERSGFPGQPRRCGC